MGLNLLWHLDVLRIVPPLFTIQYSCMLLEISEGPKGRVPKVKIEKNKELTSTLKRGTDAVSI